MTYHCYNTRIKHHIWQDLLNIKKQDGNSFNHYINEGLELLRHKKMQELTMKRKERTSLANATGW